MECRTRQPYSAADLAANDTTERYIDWLNRIGDDKDGFHEPITQAIWHFARAYPADLDEDFKHALRCVARSAKCTKQRDLNAYLSDHRLNASLRGAREKVSPLDANSRIPFNYFYRSIGRHYAETSTRPLQE